MRNLLDLKYSETSAVLMAMMIFQLLCFISWTGWCLLNPDVHAYIQVNVIKQVCWTYSIVIALGLIWMAVCLKFRAKTQWFLGLATGSVSLYAVVMVIAAYFNGLMSMTVGLVLAAAPLIGILILPPRIILTATAMSGAVLAVIGYATIAGYLAYAPIFKQQLIGESTGYSTFYFWTQVYFVIPFLVVIIWVMHQFLRQWRTREAHVRHMSETDSLTGLSNHRAARDYLTFLLKVPDTTVSIALLDLDHFQQVNTRFGHLTGDDTLRLVSSTLKACFRPDDMVARFGGEEFIMIFRDADLKTAQMLAERCRKSIEDLQIWSPTGHQIKLTASFGVAGTERLSMADRQMNILLQQADDALYQAKMNGRNRVCLAVAPLSTGMYDASQRAAI